MTGKKIPAVSLRRKSKTEIPKGYITREQAADRIERSLSSLNKYAKTRRHFNFIKKGRDTFYKETDVDEFKARRDLEKQTF